jgi:hypothetical protein
MRNISDKSCKENQNAHFMLNNFLKNCAVYEITWKNIVEWGTPQIIWRMYIACWIPKGTNAQAECVILVAFPLRQWLHKCTSLCLSCWNLENLVSCKDWRFILWTALQFWWNLACMSKSRRHLAFKNVASAALVIWFNHQECVWMNFSKFF